jgi:hypothetical protein
MYGRLVRWTHHSHAAQTHAPRSWPYHTPDTSRHQPGERRSPSSSTWSGRPQHNCLVNHGLAAVTDPRHHALEADIWGDSPPEALGTADHVLSRTIVVDGRIAGFWEVDPRTEGAVWHTFDPAPATLALQLDELTATTAAFLLAELGHAKVCTLDTNAFDPKVYLADVLPRLTRRVRIKDRS